MNNAQAKTLLGVAKPPKKLVKLVKKRVYIPAFEDPRMELRQLVKIHSKYTRDATRIISMQANKKKITGEVIKCLLPEDTRAEYRLFIKMVVKPKIKLLKEQMTATLQTIPIYNQWLSKVYGVGAVSASYICALVNTSEYWWGVESISTGTPTIMSSEHAKEIKASRIFACSLEHAHDLAKIRGLRVASDQFSLKSSAVRRFCGLSVVNGKAERRAVGVKSSYSQEMKTILYLLFVAMRKNLMKIPKAPEGGVSSAPFGKTSKYHQIYMHNKNRALVAGQKKGFAEAYGRRKCLDVFIEDFYVVSRAIDGLPVWPSYYAAKMGYEHGGKISVNAPKLITVAQALDLVGYVGGTLQTTPSYDEPVELEDNEDELAALDEDDDN